MANHVSRRGFLQQAVCSAAGLRGIVAMAAPRELLAPQAPLANAAFLTRAIAKGAKRYPPYGGVVTPAEWRVHYGDALYRRLADAKRTYDAHSVLTPGPNIFPVTQ